MPTTTTTAEYERFKELDNLISAKKSKITALQSRITNIDSEPETTTTELLELKRICDRFLKEYPFFVYRQGASGTLETKTTIFYKGLGASTSYTSDRLILGKATGGSTYPVCRTMIARTYTNSAGKEVKTTPNIAPTGNISASSSFAGHFVGHNNWAALVTCMQQIPIGELVRTQEDTLDSNATYRAAHYERSLFADLEDIGYSINDTIALQEKAREMATARLNKDIAVLTQEVSAFTEEKITIEQNLDAILAQSQMQLQEKQDALTQLEQTLENLEQNNATALAEIQAIQEEITRLEQELTNLNNANPEYNANLQELERLKAQKNTLETLATDLAAQMAAKAQEVANAQDEVNALQNEVSNKEQELQSLQSQSTQLQNDLNALQSQKQGLELQIQATEDSINKNYAKKPALETEIIQLESELANQNALSAELQAQITQLQSQKAQLELANAADPALIARINQLNAEIAELKAQIANAQYNAQSLEARISALKAQNAILKVEHIALALKKQEQITDLVGNSITHKFLVDKNNALKNTFNAQLAEISTLNENLQTLNNAIAAQTSLNLKSLYDSKLMHIEYLFANTLLKHANLNAQILKCIKIVALAHHDRIPELKAKKDAMEAEITRLNAEILELYAQILSLESEINTLKLDIKDLQEENAELLEEIATLENHREYLQNICKAENEKLKKLKESLAIKKASVNAILERIAIKRELIKKAMQQKIELNNLLYQGIGKIQLLRGKLELINTDLERTQNQIKETKWNTELM